MRIPSKKRLTTPPRPRTSARVPDEKRGPGRLHASLDQPLHKTTLLRSSNTRVRDGVYSIDLRVPSVADMQVLGRARELLVALEEEAAVVAETLRQTVLASHHPHKNKTGGSKHTLGPYGPSLTAQTLVPGTLQCEHLHDSRSFSASVPPPP